MTRTTKLLLAAALGTVCAVALNAQTSSRSFVVHDVRVFDGELTLDHQDVVVIDGIIKSVKKAGDSGNGDAIDGRGKTLLPGLIDSHTHVIGQEDTLRMALIFGVTTELDMFNSAESSKQIRTDEAAGKLNDAADFRSAGVLATAPHGHGTEYGLPIPTISAPAEAQAFVDARIAEGSDYIKIILDNGSTYGISIPTISAETLKALVIAAHKRGKLVVVHVGSLDDANEAVDAGADGLAHLFLGKMPDAEFGKRVAAHHMFVVPTLSVLASLAHAHAGAALAEDAHLAPYLDASDVKSLTTDFPFPGPKLDYSVADVSLQQLKAAHVPVLAGTDSPNPGTAHGASMHEELALLVKGGLTPTEALTAATLNPATHFHLADRGRIAPGLRADLLLVSGDPTQNINDTRNIVAVWRQGYRDNREAYAAKITATKAQSAIASNAPAGGMISDFENGQAAANFGAGWMVSTDSIAGGNSVAKIEVTGPGAQGSKGALAVTGEIKSTFAYPWAGAIFYPGPQPFAPMDASGTPAIRFWAKGDGKPARVMIFTEAGGRIPASQNFTPTAEWKQYMLPLSGFRADGKGLQAILFSASTTPGPFAFQIDDVQLVKP
jgi:imidazolonepropionase-like amidohydrolase